MPRFSQVDRPVRVDTALGPDGLLIVGFTGTESVSKPFAFRLELFSEDRALVPDDLLMTPMVVRVARFDGSERIIHGLVRSFAQLGRHEELTSYRAELVPWFWFLTLSQDCRVFQEKTVLEIVAEVFAELGWSDYRVRCARSYRTREYCVQYHETHFAFVSRLLEEEGIFWYFEHTEDGHVLVLADSNGVLDPCPGPGEVPMRPRPVPDEDHVTELEREHTLHSGAVAVTDYDYSQPPRSLDAALTGTGRGEVFEYRPRRYTEQDHGEHYARVMLERSEARRHRVYGRGSCRHFQAGFTFDLVRHYRNDLNRSYLLTEVRHSVRAGSYATWDDAFLDHDVSFVAIPADVPFRPEAITPRPRIHGAQTAEVVGKEGEEIWTDSHGRIKVQFHWDRYGEWNEHSSCWVRVASRWAGKGWGEIHLPRIGQEVVVDFLDGDPDCPLVTGSVYNGDHSPPWSLPGDQTRSGIKSRSSQGGGGYNEISIDDRKGSEQVTIHAQKDMSTRVENDRTTSVGHDETIVVSNDRTLRVAGTRSETVVGNTVLTVTEGDRTQTVATGRSDEYVKGDRGVRVDGASAHTVQDDATVNVTAGDFVLETESGKVSVDGTSGVQLSSPADVTVSGRNVKTAADLEVSVDGTAIKLTGTTEITLGVGANFVKIDASGVTISGTLVKIN